MHTLESTEQAVFTDLASLSRRSHGLRTERPSGTCAILSPSTDMLMFNRALGVGLNEAIKPAVIESLTELYSQAGVSSWGVQLTPRAEEQTALVDALRDHGFQRQDNWIKVVRNCVPIPVAECDLHIRQVREQEASEFAAVVASVYGMPDELMPSLEALVHRDSYKCVAAYDSGRVVAAGVLHVTGNMGWLGFGATLPEYRGRGAHAALVARRIQLAHQSGCAFVSSETSEDTFERPNASFRNMMRMGFIAAYPRRNWVKMAN